MGLYRIRQVKVTVRGKEHVRDVVDHPGSVCVLALTSEERILFVRQYRPGMDRSSLELPGGRIRPGEAPEEAARRETQAETGYKPLDMRLLGVVYPAPGYSSEVAYCYAAERIEPGTMFYDADEDLQVEFLAWEEALAAVRTGQVCDARSVVTLLYWGNERKDRLIRPGRTF